MAKASSDNFFSVYMFNVYDSPNKLYKMHPSTLAMTELADPPIYLSEPGIDVVDNNIYIVGCGKYSGIIAPIYKYDIDNNTYTKVKDFSQFSSHFSWVQGKAVAVGTDIYILGNNADESQRTDNYKYDTVNNTLTKMADIPYPFYDFCNAVTIGTDIYLMGSSATGHEYTMYKYDTTTNTYTQIQNDKYNLKYSQAVAVPRKNTIFIFGEKNEDNRRARAYKYDVTTNLFSENTRLPNKYHGVNSGVVYDSTFSTIYLYSEGISDVYSYYFPTEQYTNNNISLISGIYNNPELLDGFTVKIDEAVYYKNDQIQNYQYYIGNGTSWILKEGAVTVTES